MVAKLVMLRKKITNINNWLIVMFFPFSILFLILIFVLRPFVLIRFAQINSYRFGHYLMNVELYLSHKKKEPESFKSFDIFFLSATTCNLYFETMCKRHLIILPFQLLYLSSRIAKKISFFKKHLINLLYYNNDQNEHIDTVDVQLKFTKEEIKKGEELLGEIGISPNDKIVCLSIRDDKYMKNYLLSKYEIEHKWKVRNSDIQTYKLAAVELTKLGYKVVRVGRNVEHKINFENEKIIDYSRNKIRSDFLDIYLAHRCSFAFGDSSGWSTAPMAFRKYFAFANWIPFDALPYYSKRFTFIFKYYYDEKLNKFLRINEIFERKIHGYLNKELKENGIKIEDNSAEDILSLVLEVEAKFKGSFKYDSEYKSINKKFINFLKENNFFKTWYLHKEKFDGKIFPLKSSCEKKYLMKNFI